MAEGKESSGWNVQGGPFPTSVLYLNLFLNHVRSPCVPQLRRGLWILMRPDLGCRALPGFRLKGALIRSAQCDPGTQLNMRKLHRLHNVQGR